MMWSVAARFPGQGPVERMTLRVLRFWYEGHCKMWQGE